MLNDTSSPLALLATRRSGKPRDMVAPGPSADALDRMLAIAARTPDHGKLAPWRFVVVPDARRAAFEALLVAAWQEANPGGDAFALEPVRQFARQAPTLVVVLSSPRRDAKIPVWEQELSAGAAVMNLLHAVHAHGYVAGWLTGWAAFSDLVRDAFGTADERIAGFVFIGSPGRPLDERPRPDPAELVSRWGE